MTTEQTFDDLTEKEQELYTDKAAELLSDLLWCTRVWEAWDVGTMTRADFVRADEDDEIVLGTAKSLFTFAQTRIRRG